MEESVDLSGAVDMLKNMLDNEEGQQQIQNILSMFGGNAPDTSESPGEATGGIDPESVAMMLKIQKAMSAMNSGRNSSQSQLLMALKPFLKPARREKVDSAVKLLNLTRVFAVMRENGEE